MEEQAACGQGEHHHGAQITIEPEVEMDQSWPESLPHSPIMPVVEHEGVGQEDEAVQGPCRERPSPAVLCTPPPERGSSSSQPTPPRGASHTACSSSLSSPSIPGTPCSPATIHSTGEARPGASPSCSAVVTPRSLGDSSGNPGGAPASLGKDSSTTQLVSGLSKLLMEHCHMRDGEVCVAYCMNFVKLLKEVEHLERTIEKESGLAGDRAFYMHACLDYERSHLHKRISCIRRLEADFQKSRAEYNRAKSELTAAIAMMRHRINKMSVDEDFKNIAVACLQRYHLLQSNDVQALDKTTAAIEEMKKCTQQVYNLVPCVSALHKLLRSLVKAHDSLSTVGVAVAHDHASVEALKQGVLQKCQFFPVAEVTADLTKTLADLKTMRFDQLRRHKEEQTRLRALVSSPGGPSSVSSLSSPSSGEHDSRLLRDVVASLEAASNTPAAEADHASGRPAAMGVLQRIEEAGGGAAASMAAPAAAVMVVVPLGTAMMMEETDTTMQQQEAGASSSSGDLPAAEGSPLSPQHQREVDGGDAFEPCASAHSEVFPEAAARLAGMSEAAAVEQHLQADRERRRQEPPPKRQTIGPIPTTTTSRGRPQPLARQQLLTRDGPHTSSSSSLASVGSTASSRSRGGGSGGKTATGPTATSAARSVARSTASSSRTGPSSSSSSSSASKENRAGPGNRLTSSRAGPSSSSSKAGAVSSSSSSKASTAAPSSSSSSSKEQQQGTITPLGPSRPRVVPCSAPPAPRSQSMYQQRAPPLLSFRTGTAAPVKQPPPAGSASSSKGSTASSRPTASSSTKRWT